MSKKYRWILFIIGAGTFLYTYFSNNLSPLQNSELKTNTSSVSSRLTVAYVTDGDTIKLSNGDKVRYIGVDSPELSHYGSTEECNAKEARQYNESLVLNKEVILVKDVTNMDRYKRLLRYVYVIGEQGNKIFVNEQMVKEGYAFMSTYPPNVAKTDIFQKAQKFARENKKGLWNGCMFDTTKRKKRQY